MTVGTLMTATEFLLLPGTGSKQELVRGEIVEMTPPGGRHGTIAVSLGAALVAHAKAHRLGSVGVESGFILERNPDTVRAPDVYFVRADRVPTGGPPAGFWNGPPDIAVEVMSPDDRYGDVATKVDQYLTCGALAVWIVDPRARTVTVHEPHASPRLLTKSAVLTGGDALPGFEMPVREIFA